jgi:poly(3-hydroxybutyrate) depolymerase
MRPDPVDARVVAGTWTRPFSGEDLADPNGGTQTWRLAQADSDGWFTNSALRGGYAYVPFVAPSNCVMLLHARGHSMVYVNGEPRAGDVYEAGYVVLPVSLSAGTNDLLFQSGRGRLSVTLTPDPSPLSFNLSDATLPDLVRGQRGDLWAGIIILNASPHPVDQLRIHSTIDSGKTVKTIVPTIPAFSTRKVPVRLSGKAPGVGDKVTLHLDLTRAKGKAPLATGTLQLRVRQPSQTQKRTFISEIDGSVQYWALNPAGATNAETPPALFLSLHGASVEAIGQADAYSAKPWGHLAAPTNRRPYGFDWEAWGRLDALEVLAQAKAQLCYDPSRVYLTGHSMGGHGTWQLGALFPDYFAAIGPSAGWISLFGYGGGRRSTNSTPAELLLQRASASSDTLSLATNFLHHGIYILHGDADDNVPVTQARTMREQLATFHHDWNWFEQPGAGHWWDASDEPGADCVDWAPMFDFFSRHRIPEDSAVREVRFTTVNPGVSARSHWLTIAQQVSPLRVSWADVRCDPGQRRFLGRTENVALLALDVGHLPGGEPLNVELDGQKLSLLPRPKAGPLRLQRILGNWSAAGEPSPWMKGPHRSGPFKDAFRHRLLFVYGTQGTPEETAWAQAKARFDAENFWYRGNGAIEILPDTAFNPATDRDRGVVLYGNEDGNSAWGALLEKSPVRVRRGEVIIGADKISGDNLACLFLRPRPGSDVACVAVICGTGLPGMRLTDRLPIFPSGMDYPDCTVIGTERLTQPGRGVRAAGFFGNDWQIETGDFVVEPAEK